MGTSILSAWNSISGFQQWIYFPGHCIFTRAKLQYSCATSYCDSLDRRSRWWGTVSFDGLCPSTAGKRGKMHSTSPKHQITTCMKENPKSLFHEGLHKIGFFTLLFFYKYSFPKEQEDFQNTLLKTHWSIQSNPMLSSIMLTHDQSNFFTNTYNFWLSPTLTLMWASVIVGFIIICTIWSLRACWAVF